MNMRATLLGPTARPMVCIGGKGAWKTRTIKGIFCSFQWVDLTSEGLGAANACMVLINPNSMDRQAYVIPQERAYLYGHKDGTPTQHLITAAFAAADKLGVGINRSSIRNVVDIIIDGLPDLVLMPSEPPNHSDILIEHAIHGIEARAKINDRTVAEEVL